jgi:hypothetical protein
VFHFCDTDIPKVAGVHRGVAVDGKSQPTASELIIMIAGAIMLVASFLAFAHVDLSHPLVDNAVSAWGQYLFPIATLLPLYGAVMATQIALTKFVNVQLPDQVVGFTWEQFHLVLGLLAGFMAIGWLITDIHGRGIGYWIEILGGIALAVGGVMMQRERHTGAIG